MLFMLSPNAVSAKSKPTKAPRPEPELKVLELKISPTPYTVSVGALEFSAVVQLPKELDGATILEVSSLVTSPSKTSIRFLSLRKPLESAVATPVSTEPPRISVVLTWDGMDHTKTPAEVDSAHLFEALTPAQEVGHVVADLVAREQPSRLGARGEHRANAGERQRMPEIR